MAKAPQPPTERQVAFLTKLIGQEAAQEFVATGPNRQAMSSRIDLAIAAKNDAQQTQQVAPVQAGYYIKEDQVFVVVASKRHQGRVFAKKLEIHQGYDKKSARWVYAPGAVYGLNEAKPLTVEEAANLGHLHGICVICGAELTDPASVQNGIGPVCIKRLGKQAA